MDKTTRRGFLGIVLGSIATFIATLFGFSTDTPCQQVPEMPTGPVVQFRRTIFENDDCLKIMAQEMMKLKEQQAAQIFNDAFSIRGFHG